MPQQFQWGSNASKSKFDTNLRDGEHTHRSRRTWHATQTVQIHFCFWSFFFSFESSMCPVNELSKHDGTKHQRWFLVQFFLQITEMSSKRTNLSPFTKGYRGFVSRMWIHSLFNEWICLRIEVPPLVGELPIFRLKACFVLFQLIRNLNFSCVCVFNLHRYHFWFWSVVFALVLVPYWNPYQSSRCSWTTILAPRKWNATAHSHKNKMSIVLQKVFFILAQVAISDRVKL